MFWTWYEKHYRLNVTIATGLFVMQLVHLYWLATDVIAFRLLGESFFSPSPFWTYALVAVDYTEIPAILSTSLLYINDLRHGKKRSIAYLIFINSQWLHLFWITDEFVIEQFRGGGGTILPVWLAWVAIMIDYLELPVIVDTVRRVIKMIPDRRRIKK